MQTNYRASPKMKCKAQMKKDSVMLDIYGMNPDEITDYVNDKAKSINDIKKFLVMMLTNIEAGK